MGILQGVPNPKNRPFLATILKVAVKNLENAEASHPDSLWALRYE